MIGARVVRKTGSFPSSASDGTVVYSAYGTMASDSGLANGTVYYYKVFTYDSTYNFSSGTQISAVPYPTGTAVLSRTVTSAPSSSVFYALASDGAGNIYAVGYQVGTSTYSYAAGVTAFGSNFSGSQYNPVIVKYNISGVAQWARTISTGSSDAVFNAVTADASGNIIVGGYQTGSGVFTYGTGITANGTAAAPNAVLVKYNSAGTAQWAKTVTSGTSNSVFSGIVTDASGNIFAVGYQNGTGSYSYAAGVSVNASAAGKNALIVKYNSSGLAQWARSTTSGGTASEFLSVAVNAAGAVFAAGYQNGTTTYNYGSGVSGAGGVAADNSVLVKYDSSGNAQWLKTILSGPGQSHYNGVAVDADGNVFCAGYQIGTANYTYGVGVATTASSTTSNTVLIKYSFDGIAQWVRATQSGSGSSGFMALSLDSAGNIYASGYQNGTGYYYYYGGSSIAGTGAAANPLAVKFSSSGSVQWAQTVSAGGSDGAFNFIISDASGNTFAVGYQATTASYQYGVGVLMSGAVSTQNATLVKYVQ